MKSRASIKSHPLHPILVSFPIAFFTGGFVFDLLHLITGKVSFWETGYYLQLSGIITALLAAVPGIIDYLAVIPPRSSAKKRGATHGLLNITHVIIFSIAFKLRQDAGRSPELVTGLEMAGLLILGIAGWLGGTLVYRNQIGVDHRYANKGKWKEARLSPGNNKIEIASAKELALNQMKLLKIGRDKRIVLALTEEGYVAFDDHCTHRGGSLAGGVLICGTVQCPWHGSQFNTQTGEPVAGPACKAIATYRVIEQHGRLYLEL